MWFRHAGDRGIYGRRNDKRHLIRAPLRQPVTRNRLTVGIKNVHPVYAHRPAAPPLVVRIMPATTVPPTRPFEIAPTRTPVYLIYSSPPRGRRQDAPGAIPYNNNSNNVLCILRFTGGGGNNLKGRRKKKRFPPPRRPSPELVPYKTRHDGSRLPAPPLYGNGVPWFIRVTVKIRDTLVARLNINIKKNKLNSCRIIVLSYK